MVEWFQDLWTNHRVWFYILLPVGLVVLGVNIFLNYNANAGKAEVERAEKKDELLAKEQEELKDEANILKAQSDQIEKDIKKVDGDVNWHLKK